MTTRSTRTVEPVPAWFDISTPDAAGTRRFYADLFGWRQNIIDDTYALITDDDGRPMAGIGQAGPGSPYVGMVTYFRVPDLDAALARATELGGVRRMEPTEVPGMGRIAAFTDPTGNTVGLMGP